MVAGPRPRAGTRTIDNMISRKAGERLLDKMAFRMLFSTPVNDPVGAPGSQRGSENTLAFRALPFTGVVARVESLNRTGSHSGLHSLRNARFALCTPVTSTVSTVSTAWRRRVRVTPVVKATRTAAAAVTMSGSRTGGTTYAQSPKGTLRERPTTRRRRAAR